MKMKFFFSVAVFLAVLAFAACDQEPFERRSPLPIPSYDGKTGYDPFDPNGDELTPKLWIKSAEVVAGTPSVIKVTFSEAVTIADISRFTVKVNDAPAVRVGQFSGNTDPLLDKSMTSRTVTAAEPASSGRSDTWNLTINAPAKHGEILRLALSLGAVVGRELGVVNAVIPEVIVQNLVPRGGFVPTAAGFYEGSTNKTSSLASGTGETLYQRAITWLATPANQTNGAVYTIALGANQTYTGAATFTSAQLAAVSGTVAANAVIYASRSFTIVLTSADNTEKIITVSESGSALVLRGGVTLIIDKNVAIEHANQGAATNPYNGQPLIRMDGGGKLILDGGEIRKNYRSGLFTDWTGGAAGVAIYGDDGGINTGGQAYFIMNSGKVTQNVMEPTEAIAAAGGVSILGKGYFVMHGGEVSNNETIHSTASQSRDVYGIAGGIAATHSVMKASQSASTSRVNLQAIYITGGEIKGNKITGGNTTNPGVSAGGIMIFGTFQKTGGTIKDNINDVVPGIRRLQVGVQYGTKDGDTSQHWYRDAAAGEDVILFTAGVKASSPNASAAGTVIRPTWIPNNWKN